MIRKQFFIKEEQDKQLKKLVARLGVSEAELIREGIDKILAAKDSKAKDWKQGWKNALEVSGDFADLGETVALNRECWKERTAGMVERGLLGDVKKNDDP